MATYELDRGLLPDYNQLRSQVNWDYTLRNYIESRGSTELAVAFAKLFWPDFVEYRGCVITSDGFTEAGFDAWWDRLKGDRVAIEHILNHIHVLDLLPNDRSELDPSVCQFLGAAIVEMWASRVRQLFPNRRFIVRLENAEDGANAGPTVQLFQDRSQYPEDYV
jgi:hypothetical protein